MKKEEKIIELNLLSELLGYLEGIKIRYPEQQASANKYIIFIKNILGNLKKRKSAITSSITDKRSKVKE